MRHGLYIIILAVLSLVALDGCKAQKHVQKSSNLIRAGEKITQTIEKQIEEKKVGTDIRIERQETQNFKQLYAATHHEIFP